MRPQGSTLSGTTTFFGRLILFLVQAHPARTCVTSVVSYPLRKENRPRSLHEHALQFGVGGGQRRARAAAHGRCQQAVVRHARRGRQPGSGQCECRRVNPVSAFGIVCRIALVVRWPPTSSQRSSPLLADHSGPALISLFRTQVRGCQHWECSLVPMLCRPLRASAWSAVRMAV